MQMTSSIPISQHAPSDPPVQPMNRTLLFTCLPHTFHPELINVNMQFLYTHPPGGQGVPRPPHPCVCIMSCEALLSAFPLVSKIKQLEGELSVLKTG